MSLPRDLRYRVEAGAARLVIWLAAILPIGLVVAMANLAGWIAYHVWAERRSIAIVNLVGAGVARDVTAARTLTLECFRTFCRMIAESVVALKRLSSDSWRGMVTMHWSDEVRGLIEKQGQPILLASAHIGNWEIAARAASMIRPVTYVHRPLSNPHLEQIIMGGRSGANLHIVSSLDRDPFRFIEMLNQGNMVALMVDQHAGDQRIRVNFFGRPAWTTKSVAMLHLLTGAPLVAAFAIRTGPLQYEAHFSEPIRFTRSGDREKDALEITQRLTDEVEKIARQFPGQYMWGHRRWKP